MSLLTETVHINNKQFALIPSIKYGKYHYRFAYGGRIRHVKSPDKGQAWQMAVHYIKKREGVS